MKHIRSVTYPSLFRTATKLIHMYLKRLQTPKMCLRHGSIAVLPIPRKIDTKKNKQKKQATRHYRYRYKKNKQPITNYHCRQPFSTLKVHPKRISRTGVIPTKKDPMKLSTHQPFSTKQLRDVPLYRATRHLRGPQPHGAAGTPNFSNKTGGSHNLQISSSFARTSGPTSVSYDRLGIVFTPPGCLSLPFAANL